MSQKHKMTCWEHDTYVVLVAKAVLIVKQKQKSSCDMYCSIKHITRYKEIVTWVYLELSSEQVVGSHSKPNVADSVILTGNMKLFIKNAVNDKLTEQSLGVRAIKTKLTAAIIHATSVMSTVQHLRILWSCTFHTAGTITMINASNWAYQQYRWNLVIKSTVMCRNTKYDRIVLARNTVH